MTEPLYCRHPFPLHLPRDGQKARDMTMAFEKCLKSAADTAEGAASINLIVVVVMLLLRYQFSLRAVRAGQAEAVGHEKTAHGAGMA